MIDLIKNNKLLIFCVILIFFLGFQRLQIKEKESLINKITRERDSVTSQMESLKYQSDKDKRRIEELNKISHEDAKNAAEEADKILDENISNSCQESIDWAKNQAIKGI